MSTQSLPSFAQAFSSHIPPPPPPAMPSRKRTTQDDDDDDDDVHVHVKQEMDSDSTPTSHTHNTHNPNSTTAGGGGAPPPSALMPSTKKRRVTVSGTALHIDVVRPPPSDVQPASTPISPVVIGFNVQRDNPNAMEQVRSMIGVKQKQKALIEQRRGSAAGLGLGPGSPIVGAGEGVPPTPRATRRSPNNRAQRASPPPSQTHVHPLAGQQQQQQQSQQQQQQQSQQLQSQQQQQQQQPHPAPPIPQHSLPPPPISFARRRAALLGGKKKPADIVISPRSHHARDHLAPAIQSAPPVPQAGSSSLGGSQAQYYTTAPRFPMGMALPRLPSLSGQETTRRVVGNVPPTPTRLAMLQQQQQQQQQQHPIPSLAHHGQHAAPHAPSSLGLGPNTSSSSVGVAASSTSTLGATTTTNPAPSTRSPPASIPIATSLVPPTPTSLHRPGYTGDKAAFLAPFEIFYDALNDSRQLKTWLGEQVRESRALIAALGREQERMGEAVEREVEKRLVGVRGEVGVLRRRVEELEAAAAAAAAKGGGAGPGARSHAGVQQQMLQEGYTFPPAPPSTAVDNATAGPSNHHSGLRTRHAAPDMGRRMEVESSVGVNGWTTHEREREREYMRDRDHASRTGEREREREQHASGGGGSLSRQSSLTGDGYAVERERAERERSDRDRVERERERDRSERERERAEREYMERERERERELREREREGMRDRELRERERDGMRDRDGLREREREPMRERERNAGRSSRRNSVVMAGPEEEEGGEDVSGVNGTRQV